MTDRVARGRTAAATDASADSLIGLAMIHDGASILDEMAATKQYDKLMIGAGIVKDYVHANDGAGVWTRAQQRMTKALLRVMTSGHDTAISAVSTVFAEVNGNDTWPDTAKAVHKAAVVDLITQSMNESAASSSGSDPSDSVPSDGERLTECEECGEHVAHVQPCYGWDHNSMRVCDGCLVTINAEHPGGDPS